MLIRANLDISGVDPSRVAEILGVAPDTSWREGDATNMPPQSDGRKRLRSFHLWRITEETGDALIGVGKLISDLANRMSAANGKVSTLPNEAAISCLVSVSLEPGEGAPSCAIGQGTVAFLAAIGADLDIDISV